MGGKRIDWTPAMLRSVGAAECNVMALAKAYHVSEMSVRNKRRELLAAKQPATELVPTGSSATTAIAEAPDADLTVVATRPEEMNAAREQLAAWFQQKVEAVKAEARDARENLQITIQAGIKHESFQRASRAAERRVVFYEKCLEAVENGYTIVPNFPVDVLAIRVGRERPRWATSTASTPWGLGEHLQKCELLPTGEGTYVNQVPYVKDNDITPAGAERKTLQRTVTDYAEVEFPVEIAKPAVLDAVRRAMALKLFDEIGVLPARRRPDPVVIGRIYKPNRTAVAFLIAWWIDVRDF